MLPKRNKSLLKAVIREDECIGCTKCIAACPADAILGSHKYMHTVIADECIGCELCITPCPVDCIDMVVVADQMNDKTTRLHRAVHFKMRYQTRVARLEKEQQREVQLIDSAAEKKAYIEAALERIKRKKSSF